MPAPARAVDHALRMLDAKAHRERLGLHVHAALVEHGEGVARAVAQSHHGMVGLQPLALAAVLVQHFQGGETAVLALAFDAHVTHALAEADLAAQADDLLAYSLDHLHQLEGADVRVRGIEDLWRCAVGDEFLHHLAAQVARVLDLAVELAVGEGACAAFAELHIGLGHQLALAPQAPGVLGALAHRAAALDHDGPEAHLCQHQGRKDAAGPEAHHHGPALQVGRRLAHGMPAHVGRGVHMGMAGELLQQCGFLALVGQRQVDDVDGQQLGLARIEAALVHVHGGNGLLGNAQLARGQGAQRLQGQIFGVAVGVVLHRRQGQFQFRDADHGLYLSSRGPAMVSQSGRPHRLRAAQPWGVLGFGFSARYSWSWCRPGPGTDLACRVGHPRAGPFSPALMGWLHLREVVVERM